MAVVRDTHARSVGKAVSWRILGTFATSVIVFIFTHRWGLSLFVGAMEFVSKIGLFWVHERLWDRLNYGRVETKPSVIWFTGLSGSGKSTISDQVTAELRRLALKVEHLDGDSVRAIFPNTGFTRPDRDAHIKRVGFLASRLESHGVFVVASLVSPYRESRDAVRAMCNSFVEVFVNTPLDVCEQRDVKGLYAKARSGELQNFTGISDPYEPPTKADVVIDTTRTSVDEAVRQIMANVQSRMSTGMIA
ncbi:MAG: adenylyl-sulfate kinase [bacterium]